MTGRRGDTRSVFKVVAFRPTFPPRWAHACFISTDRRHSLSVIKGRRDGASAARGNFSQQLSQCGVGLHRCTCFRPSDADGVILYATVLFCFKCITRCIPFNEWLIFRFQLRVSLSLFRLYLSLSLFVSLSLFGPPPRPLPPPFAVI